MNRLIISLVLIFASISSGQYVPKSWHLSEPARNIPYIDSCAQFWYPAWDNSRGGFYSDVNRQGNPFGNTKAMLSQTRNAYGYVRAYMLTGKDEYLNKADEILQWMYDHAWDDTYGGWYGDLDIYGNPKNPTANKSAFDQHYALLGITAFYEATRDTSHWNMLKKGFDILEQKYWDSSTQFYGYYDYANYNLTGRYDKSFNATVDAITTHLLGLYLMTGDSLYYQRLLDMAENMSVRLLTSMNAGVIGFAEKYDSYWRIKTSETTTIMGHVLKTAWCLGRIYNYIPDPRYLEAAETLFNDVLSKGYDHQFGGPYKDYNRTNGVMMMYGQDTAKAWWQMEQAVTGGLELYYLTGDEKYLKAADESLDFFMQYFVDPVYGEIYMDRLKWGTPPPGWGDNKGSPYKAAYHSIETGYYAYLYGNLMLHKQPVSLYYRILPSSENRAIRMNPIAFQDDGLIIDEIFLDGVAYYDFNQKERILNLSAGVGGEFLVKYKPVEPSGVEGTNILVKDFNLFQNYPNPFNPETTIGYELVDDNFVKLSVFDMLGRNVAELVSAAQEAGRYKVRFNASGLAGGVYFYKISIGSQEGSVNSEVKKMILLK